MKVSILAIVFTAFSLGSAYAQAPVGQPTPTVNDLDQQLQEVGCRAERQTAAQTIINLQKQVSLLQDQLKKADPPKSGATRK